MSDGKPWPRAGAFLLARSKGERPQDWISCWLANLMEQEQSDDVRIVHHATAINHEALKLWKSWEIAAVVSGVTRRPKQVSSSRYRGLPSGAGALECGGYPVRAGVWLGADL